MTTVNPSLAQDDGPLPPGPLSDGSGNGSETIECPACGTANSPDAVFCINHQCHKALGEFRYVLEELRAKRSRFDQLAGRVTEFAGHPHFITVHLAWFLVWVLVNSGMIAALRAFDAYPYGLLGIILAVEAILITSFVLITQNRENAYAEMRAELDYEVSIRSYRKLEKLEERLSALILARETQETPRSQSDVDQKAERD
jgi:uncharacterized membrane protein